MLIWRILWQTDILTHLQVNCINKIISISKFHTHPPIATMCVGCGCGSLSLWMLSAYVPNLCQAHSFILSPYWLYMGRRFIVYYSQSHAMFPINIISLKSLLGLTHILRHTHKWYKFSVSEVDTHHLYVAVAVAVVVFLFFFSEQLIHSSFSESPN